MYVYFNKKSNIDYILFRTQVSIKEDGLFLFRRKKNRRKCKRWIKKHFKKVDLKSLELKYHFRRRIKFIEEEILPITE